MTTRRLAAIVVADVVGFSAMMAHDEEGTLATLKAHRAATDPVILNHGGRIVKTTGDGLVVEVPSAVDAVRAALEVQRVMAERNAGLAPARRMHYRIGVNLGDVIVDDDGDVYGDGVNVAARLEGLADPGGVCLSEAVHRQVVAVLVGVAFEDRGEQALKNIPTPVRTWALRPEGSTAVDPHQPAALGRPFSPDTTVAVLPFDDLSADPDQAYVADGIVEDLITALSHQRGLQVIARNSVFAFRGRPTDVRTVGRQLDARYVVEGSVRRSGDRIRITAQLIDSETGRHLWAEKFDREFGDVFALQDEIVDAVRVRVVPTVRHSEQERLATLRTDDLQAWDLLNRARWHANRHGIEDVRTAIDLAERALAFAPSAAAHMDLADYWVEVAHQGWHIDDRNPHTQLLTHANAAYRLAPDDAFVLATVAHARSYSGDTAACVELARRAVERNPHAPTTWTCLAHTLNVDGRHDDAVEAATEAWRLAAHEPWRWHIATILAYAHYLRRAHHAASQWASEALTVIDYVQAHTVQAAALAQLGRVDEAHDHLARLLDGRPGLRAADYGRRFNWRNPADIDHFLDGLVAAGLPE